MKIISKSVWNGLKFGIGHGKLGFKWGAIDRPSLGSYGQNYGPFRASQFLIVPCCGIEHAVESSMMWNQTCCGIKPASLSGCAPPSAAAFFKKNLERGLWNRGCVEYGFCGIRVLWNKACCGIKHFMSL